MRTIGSPVWILSLSIVAGACGKGDDSGDPGVVDLFPTFINVTTAPVGDLTCFDGATWITETPDPTCQVERAVSGEVVDFETQDPVLLADVSIFYADAIGTTVNQSGQSDGEGNVALSSMTCQPITYSVTTDPLVTTPTKLTIESHAVYPPEDPVDTQFNSVSDTTYRLIPSLLGVSVKEGYGIAAGTVYGCPGEGSTVENAQVVVRDADGNIPDTLVVKYFIDEFPNRDQPNTSADGLWVAINLPPGEWFIDAYVADGADGHLLIGTTHVAVNPDSINISNIFAGHDNGVKFPEACLSACL